MEPERASLLARLATGRPGWALQAASDESILARRTELIDQARSLPRLSIADRMDLAENLTDASVKDRDIVFKRLGGWQDWWRDVMVVQRGAEQAISGVDRLDDLRDDAAAYDPSSVIRFADASRQYTPVVARKYTDSGDTRRSHARRSLQVTFTGSSPHEPAGSPLCSL